MSEHLLKQKLTDCEKALAAAELRADDATAKLERFMKGISEECRQYQRDYMKCNNWCCDHLPENTEGNAVDLVLQHLDAAERERDELKRLLDPLKIDLAQVGPEFKAIMERAVKRPTYWQELTLLAHDEYKVMRTERDSLAATCAEMRGVIHRMYNWEDDDRSASIDAAAQHALSSDCGKGWRSPEEYAALEAKCAEMRVLINKTMSMTSCIFCGCSWPMGRTVEQTLRHEEECPMFHALSGDCGRDYVPRKELEEARRALQKIRCIYCGFECSYEESTKLADHILTCEKSPLVELNKAIQSKAEDLIDLTRDEFIRICALTDNSEIHGICSRSQEIIDQKYPVIKQRDEAVAERDKLKVVLKECVEALESSKPYLPYVSEGKYLLESVGTTLAKAKEALK